MVKTSTLSDSLRSIEKSHRSIEFVPVKISHWNEVDAATIFHFSDKNRFVTGSKNGHVTLWANSVSKTKKIFNNAEQEKNATFVKYANNKIYAIAKRDSKLTILDLELNTLKIIDHEFEKGTLILTVTDEYVAVGDCFNVTVFDKNYNVVLVSSISSFL